VRCCLQARSRGARVQHLFRYAHVYPRTVAMLASGEIDVAPLITDTFAFADSIEAFDFARAMPPTSERWNDDSPSGGGASLIDRGPLEAPQTALTSPMEISG
jgi:hypothetical protein